MFTNEIIKKALSLAGFSDVQSLTEIINAVPNPQVALAMILGVYEKQTLLTNKYYQSSYYDEIYELKDTNDLLKTCLLEKHKPTVKDVWYLTREDVNSDCYLEIKPTDAYTSRQKVSGTGFKTSLETKELDCLEGSLKCISEEEYFKKLDSFTNMLVLDEEFAMAG